MLGFFGFLISSSYRNESTARCIGGREFASILWAVSSLWWLLSLLWRFSVACISICHLCVHTRAYTQMRAHTHTLAYLRKPEEDLKRPGLSPSTLFSWDEVTHCMWALSSSKAGWPMVTCLCPKAGFTGTATKIPPLVRKKQLLQPPHKVPTVNQSTILPKFTLGSQKVYWAYAQSMGKGLLEKSGWHPKAAALRKSSISMDDGFPTGT